MMTLHEIGLSASNIGSQVSVGVSAEAALERMVAAQPNYADFWQRAVVHVRGGGRLSAVMEEVWPASVVSALKAGEQSGDMGAVFLRIEETVELQMGLLGKVQSLIYPATIALAGLIFFLAFIIFGMPLMAKSLNLHGDPSPLFQLSAWLSPLVQENFIVIGAGTGIGVTLLIGWLKTQEARTALLDICLTIPMVRTALRDMYFGLWAKYVALMAASGLTTIEALRLSAPVLPGPLRASIEAFEHDLSVTGLSLSQASDLSKLDPNDPRVEWWPFYIVNAFIVAEQSGDINKEMTRASAPLLKAGEKTLSRVIFIGNAIAIFVAAGLALSPMGAYYIEMFAAVRSFGN